MTASRALLAGLLVVPALLLQTVLVARLPVPYGGPDLVLLVVIALALAGGPGLGMGAGFAGGLLEDLLSDHPAGLLALVLLLVGYACGHFAGTTDEGVLPPLLVVAAATVGAVLGYAVLLGLTGSARLDGSSIVWLLPVETVCEVLLAPFLLPGVAALHGRLVTGKAR